MTDIDQDLVDTPFPSPGYGDGHRPSRGLSRIMEQLESADVLDVPAAKLERISGAVASSGLGPLLRGDAVGHAAHPLLTDIPIGCWTCAAMLDVAGGSASRSAARKLIGWGVLAAVPTAASGLVEAATLGQADRASRRVVTAHVGLNALAVVSYAASWADRRHSHHARGVAWSAAGAVAASAAGHLGGHLAFVRGIGQGDRGQGQSTSDRDRRTALSSAG